MKISTNQCKRCFGTAIHIRNSNYSILNSTFEGNVAENGGAIYIIDSYNSYTTINHTNITGNEALGSGGGIYIENSQLITFNTLISLNKAYIGGGIRF